MTGILVPNAPRIAGLRFRTYAGRADVPAMTRVMNSATLANESPEFRTEAMVRNWMEHPSSTDPYEDVVLAFVGDELAAVSVVAFEDANEGMRHYQAIGMTSAQLGVDTQNPNDAHSLYRRHRFEPAAVETEWHKPLELKP